MTRTRFNLHGLAVACAIGTAVAVPAWADDDLHAAQRQVRRAEEDLRRAERQERYARRDFHRAREDETRSRYWIYTAPSAYQDHMYRSQAQASRLAALGGERDRLLKELGELDPYLAEIEAAATDVREALGSMRERHAAAVESARQRVRTREEYVAAQARLSQSEAEVRAATSDALERLEQTETFRRLLDQRDEAIAVMRQEAASERERAAREARVEELERAISAVRERFLAEDWRVYAARAAHSRAFNDAQAMEQPLLQEELARDPEFDVIDAELAALRREAEVVDRDLQQALARREAIVRNLHAVDDEMDRTYRSIIEHDAYAREIEIRRMREAHRAADAEFRTDLAAERARRARYRSERAEDRLQSARQQEEREARRSHLSPDPPRVNPAPGPQPRVEPAPAPRVERQPERQPDRRTERRRQDDEESRTSGPQPETPPPAPPRIMPRN